ncbi:hypothetical protein [Brucella pseudogrignonensis]|uniref:hypothetical protein n=1 Tax=Brucella pseudogrignonensis TaxID=419475 RepID=UPI000CFB2B3A|nr:hypothetical protein [Brucella pseudogrignonensis]MQP40936.1 hypothetical protein [Ochrobactrum sp. MYb237]PQZ40889.1 hypothetical protein CQ059_16695 [Brucella pseudogrignonensis]PRA40392.1 hypothetical protein CQ063_12460 [Brucella pseudogrignonensis]PRA68985.1 hypothetical protein CQ055_12345 [Brucella pseudogrignonensis]
MSKRIFIGEHNHPSAGKRMMVRITPPGQNADDLGAPAVYSSDNDFLRVHTRSSPAGEVMTNIDNGGADGNYLYTLYRTFPDLGYLPLIFYTVCIDSEGGLNNRVIYPWDSSVNTSRYPVAVNCAISNNAVWFSCEGKKFSQTLKIKYTIFKNRLL